MTYPVTGLLAGPWVRAVALRTADLANVLLPDPPPPARVEEVLRAHGETGPFGLTPADVRAMAAAAHKLRDAATAPDTAASAQRINALLSGVGAPRLTDHGGAAHWHLHVDASDEGPLDEWLLSSGAMALAVLLADQQRVPGGVCAAPGCDRMFLDPGTGGRRRYCSARCGTRTRVAAHRRRARG
ncbi:CGNR zinc finger domain-containing protein [Nocardiopsis sp. RSe5-2]|uniref:CGNR zinc finger domain-containing protein n=1 Tax=Nocardiopsis endophytica TaxID=3018445 RepID=A0ABT4U8L1_9ACTN|nr:CGNR zinc finger domain-containing protein [Nocardiopsis endophytica]MDA2812750.1 CGNR zinc finger domain-containing protein [Nocardiopsis endophytica]